MLPMRLARSKSVPVGAPSAPCVDPRPPAAGQEEGPTASGCGAAKSCMPWSAGITVLQVVLILGVLAELALVAARWDRDHSQLSPRQGRRASLDRQQREFQGLQQSGETDYNSSAAEKASKPPVEGHGEAFSIGSERKGSTPSSRGARARLRGSGVDVGGDARHGSEFGGTAGGGLVEQDPRLHHEELFTWPYTCWTPREGMSQPQLTIVTVIDGLPYRYQKAVWHNRMQYAAKWGHRYCELQMHDRSKIPAFTKLPWMLALAPCTDFVFHLDADAMIAHMDLPLSPWLQFMQSKNIDQLFSQDCIRESAINYGVFMIRTASWIWDFYRRIYNTCTCDWGRMHDWPAEQGIVYDLIASQMDSFEAQRSLIVPGKGWNHILGGSQDRIEDWDVVVHLTWPNAYPVNHSCWESKYRDDNSRQCKYLGLEYYMTNVISTSPQQHSDLNLTALFVEEENNCQQVRQNSLFVSKTTYSNQGDALPGSVLDFDVDPATGQVLGVKVSEVGCLGYRERKCSLPSYWDAKQGTGPWEVYKADIV